MTTTVPRAAAIAALLRAHYWSILTEAHLQAGIADVLHTAGIDFTREVRLSGRDRIDFLAGDVGIEVKVAGPAAPLLTQLMRYAEHDQVGRLLVVTTKAAHTTLPMMVGRKPLHIVLLRGAG